MSVRRLITKRRVLWAGSIGVLIAGVAAGTALMLHNDPAKSDASPSAAAIANAADAQCTALGYEASAREAICHDGFVAAVLVVQHQTPKRWSQTTADNAAYSAQLVLSQSGAPLPLFGNRQMRSEPWMAGFEGGVRFAARHDIQSDSR